MTMTGETRNRAHRLRRRPEGSPSDVDLKLVEEAVPGLEPGQALVRTTHLWVDPTTRVRMSDYPAHIHVTTRRPRPGDGPDAGGVRP